MWHVSHRAGGLRANARGDGERCDPERERDRLDLLVARLLHEGRQPLARGKLLDRLVQVGVGVGAVAGHGVAQPRQDVPEIPEVARADNRRPRQREFEDGQPAAWLRDTGHLGQAPRRVGDVPKAEGNRHQIELGRGEGQLHGVGLDPLDGPAGLHALHLAPLEHRPAEVTGYEPHVWAGNGGIGQREVARATADVEDRSDGWRWGPPDGRPTPEHVYAAGQEPVDKVVAGCDLGKHPTDTFAALVNAVG